MISVVIPTVDGREDHYERCYNAYRETLDGHDEFEIITIANRPTCGEAWQEGADRALGEFIHFTADDLVPHAGWAEAAMQAARGGILPMPKIYGPDGNIEPLGPATQGCTRIPFCTSEQWERIGPMIPLHYYTDNWFSLRAKEAGFVLATVPSYTFTHNWAEAARGAGMSQQERMVHDREKFIHYAAHGYTP